MAAYVVGATARTASLPPGRVAPPSPPSSPTRSSSGAPSGGGANGGGASNSGGEGGTLPTPRLPSAPTDLVAPNVTGTPVVGQHLTTSTGTWSGQPTAYAYQWEDCDPSGGDCAAIVTATDSGYTLASSDTGHTIRAVVSALNAGGTTTTRSAPTAVITTPAPPVGSPTSSAAPTIVGTPQVGAQLTAHPGSWTNAPTTYSYEWEDCAAGSCTPIANATTSIYTVASGDTGSTLVVVVTASNIDGSGSARSAPTAVVAQPPTAQVFVAQSASGSGNGSSCANAESASWFETGANWGTGHPIAPGVVVGLCGTISSDLAAQGSGSPGNPITLYFEPGAKLSQPACANACLSLNGQSYLIVDGGENGIIENTANGTGLSMSVGDEAIAADPCNNCTIENLTIRDVYVRMPFATVTGDVTNGDTTISNVSSFPVALTAGNTITGANLPTGDKIASVDRATHSVSLSSAATGTSDNVSFQVNDDTPGAQNTKCMSVSGHNLTVAYNTMNYAFWCVYVDENRHVDSNIQLDGNNISDTDHGIALAFYDTSATGGPFYFYNNYIHDYAAWDSGAEDLYHHDGFHCYAAGSGVPDISGGLYLYNNVFGGRVSSGNVGTDGNDTAQIFLEGTASGTPCATPSTPIYLFNNVDEASPSGSAPDDAYWTLASGTIYAYNNTLLGNGSDACFDFNDQTTPPATIENTLISGCASEIGNGSGGLPYGGMIPDYNLYAAGASGAFTCDATHYGFAAFSSWRACIGGDSHSSTTTDALVNADGSLQANSPALAAGTNLYATCDGQPKPGLGALCENINGVPRPTSGPWDDGAF